MLNFPLTVSETFQRDLAVTLADGGHQVVVHALQGDDPPAGSLPPGISFSLASPKATDHGAARLGAMVRSPRRPLAQMARRAVDRFGWTARAARAAALAGPIWATRPDVVHAGFSGIAVSLADVWDLLDDVPLVVSCRGTDELVRPELDPALRPALARLFRQATVVHAVADAVADAVVGLGADPAQVRVVKPAVDLDRWAGAAAPLDGPPWRLATVTRLVPAKGVDDLLAAIAALRHAGTDVTLAVVGEGPHLEALRLRARRTGVDGAVTFVGACSQDGVAAELGRAHAYVSPSLSEGISNGVLEAMASGVAVVSTEVGGMGEVITDGVDGWLVAPGRPDRLAEAISHALADPERLRRVAVAGRERVVTGFGRPDQARAWLAIYRGVGGKHRSALVGATGEDCTP